MTESKESRSIAKTNLVFGGVKIFQMLVALVKNKIVAVLLGPAGMGVQSLLITTINTIYQLANLGVPQSSVRELAIQKTEEGKSKVLASINILSIILGVLAGFFSLVFSKQLSYLVFSSYEYQICFIIISLALFFESISGCEIAILQGLRETRRLAVASLFGAVLALVISVPLYYVWRVRAIPYVLSIGYALSAVVYYIYRKKKIRPVRKYSIKEVKSSMRSILQLGVTLMISNCIMSLLSMALNLVISKTGSYDDVGYYQAAYNCTYSFITILIAILASDYYPRLSEKIGDNEGTCGIISTQMRLFFFVLMPIISFIVCFPHAIVTILYSAKFYSIELPIQLMGIALIFRVIWQIFSYVILAKGDRKAFLCLDAFLGNGLFFVGNIVGFYFWGLRGLSISYLLMSLVVMLLLQTYVRLKYKLPVSFDIILKSVAFVFFSLFVVWFSIQYNSLFAIFLKVLYFGIAVYFCLVSLQKELDIVGVVKNFVKNSNIRLFK